MGQRASNTTAVFFEDVVVPDEVTPSIIFAAYNPKHHYRPALDHDKQQCAL